MAASDSPTVPTPPGLIASLMAGFDAIANHAELIIFPIALDLLIWLGPHFRFGQLAEAALRQMMNLPGSEDPQMAEMMRTNLEMWQQIAERVNLMSLLRSYPVGIPSLMSGRLPIAVPGGAPAIFEITSIWSMIGLLLVFTIVGLILGALYYSLVAQAAIGGQVDLRKALITWPRTSLQVLTLTLIMGVILMAVLLPATCLLAMMTLVGASLSQCMLFLIGGMLIWFSFPLLLSTHGIFVHGSNVIASVMSSIRLSRHTLPTTAMLFLSVMVISQGLNLLWNVPQDSSWLVLVGLAGHAFITTSLLAATFVYYREAETWVKEIATRRALEKPKSSSGA